MTDYREIDALELIPALFKDFDRYQEVNRCWRKEDGCWLLKDIAFVEQWDAGDYALLSEALAATIRGGGVVLGAFRCGRLAGFASLENERFGSERQYLQLAELYVSRESRGGGIGRMLFRLTAAHARRLGARKLYLSAQSSEESQAFYRAVGCVEAIEYNAALVEKEPCDCQLEYVL